MFPLSRTSSSGAEPPGSARHRVLDHVVSKTWAADADLTERQGPPQQVPPPTPLLTQPYNFVCACHVLLVVKASLVRLAKHHRVLQALSKL